MNDRMAPGEFYRVRVAEGDERSMTLDELDRAFQDDVIGEQTYVLAPGWTRWAKLAAVAGLDAPRPSVMDMSAQLAAMKPRRGRWLALATVGLLIAIGGATFAAKAVPAMRAAASASPAAPAVPRALDAVAKAPRIVPVPIAAVSAPVLSAKIDAKKKDKAHEMASTVIKKKRLASPHRRVTASTASGMSTFLEGGNKYDPLNASL